MIIHVISHGTCPDGHASAFMLDRVLTANEKYDEIVHWPVGYEHPMFLAGADLSFTKDAAIYCVDFCPPAHWLDQVSLHAASVLVLDHHQTAAESIVPALQEYGGPGAFECFGSIDEWENGPSGRYEIVVDQSHSGVGLVAQWARVMGADPDKILYVWPWIEDRDLWKFELPETRDISAALAARPYTFEAWEELRYAGFDNLVTEGRAINTFRDQLIDACIAKPFPLDLEPPGVTALACTAPYLIGSDCAGRLAEQSPNKLGAYIIVHGDHVQIGLRSTPDGPDCALIAEALGGGGHKHASGIRLAHADLPYALRA